MTSTNQGANKWAVLVGVSFQFPAPPDGPTILNLRGPVPDIEKVDAFIQKHQGIPKDHIIKLLASPAIIDRKESTTTPRQPKAEWPTYENIKNAFETIIQKASRGDFVYFHYSGHGGRFPTAYPPSWKGPNAFDEILVTTDIFLTGDILTDVKMAYFLNEMVVKGLHLTVVLDCCHSGGAVRAEVESREGGGVPRYAELGFAKGLLTDKPDIPLDKLKAGWESQKSREGKVREGRLLNPSGYQLFTACRADESAWEMGSKGGLLSYYLLDALQEGRSDVTQAMLYRRIYDGVQNSRRELNEYFEPQIRKGEMAKIRQIPGLEGNTGFPFFRNGDEGAKNIGITGIIFKDKEMVRIHAGAAHGVCVGSRYAVYRWDATDLTNPETRLAEVVVIKVHALKSEVALERGNMLKPYHIGLQAVLISRPTEAQQILALPPSVPQAESAHASLFQSRLNINSSGYLAKQFEISIQGQDPNEKGIYEIERGAEITVEFHNLCKVPIYLTAFQFGCQGQVSQIYPYNTDFEALDYDDRFTMKSTMTIPEGLDSSYDVIKAWVTTKPTFLRSLEMPKLPPASDGNLDRPWVTNLLTQQKQPRANNNSAAVDADAAKWDTLQLVINTCRFE